MKKGLVFLCVVLGFANAMAESRSGGVFRNNKEINKITYEGGNNSGGGRGVGTTLQGEGSGGRVVKGGDGSGGGKCYE